MSFNVHNVTLPWYLLGAGLAIALTPVAPGLGPLFWAGALVSLTLFVTLVALSEAGDPCTETCCGALILGPLLALVSLGGWLTASAHPKLVAVAPWVVLSAGTAVGVLARLASRLWPETPADPQATEPAFETLPDDLDPEATALLAERLYLSGRLRADALDRLDPARRASILRHALELARDVAERPSLFGLAQAVVGSPAPQAAPLLLHALRGPDVGAFRDPLKKRLLGDAAWAAALAETPEAEALRDWLRTERATHVERENRFWIDACDQQLAALTPGD